MMLRVQHLQACYGRSQALFDIAFEIGAGEVVTLLGRNGAGKTTTIRAIMGLLGKTGGEVAFCDDPITDLEPQQVARRGIGLVPEGRQVFPTLTVYENLVATSANRHHSHSPWTLPRVLQLFPALRDRQRQAAGTLSGGEQQMVAIGRALMARPSLLCMDEPSMGLSPAYVEQVFDIIEAINRRGTAIFMVEQNANMALTIAHRAYVLQTGQVVLGGTAESLRQNDLVRQAYLGEIAA